MFKHISILLFVLFCAHTETIGQSKKQNFILTGNVKDEATGLPLQGASIYFPEFKKGVITKENGTFEISIPNGEHIVEVSFIGYALLSKTITVKENRVENFALGHGAVENANVTVTSFLRATSSRKTPTPISILKKEDLFKFELTDLQKAALKLL